MAMTAAAMIAIVWIGIVFALYPGNPYHVFSLF